MCNRCKIRDRYIGDAEALIIQRQISEILLKASASPDPVPLTQETRERVAKEAFALVYDALKAKLQVSALNESVKLSMAETNILTAYVLMSEIDAVRSEDDKRIDPETVQRIHEALERLAGVRGSRRG